jgi:ElaB/YqjD/DUF883 family membrane-anchored ribosome-binding protein
MDTTTPTTAANGQEGLLHNLRHMVDEADQFLKSAAQSGDAKFDAVRGRFASQLRHMRLQLDELEDNAIYKARRAARNTDLAIQTHPYGAMGVAAAVGLLIGFLAARR